MILLRTFLGRTRVETADSVSENESSTLSNNFLQVFLMDDVFLWSFKEPK